MSEVNRMIHRLNVLVTKLPKEKDAQLMKQCSNLCYKGISINKETSLLFNELSSKIDKPGLLKEVWILEFIVKLGNVLCKQNEIKDSFWINLLVCVLSSAGYKICQNLYTNKI